MRHGTSATLQAHRAIREAKPALRAVYHDYYRRMAARTRPGRTLELGAGTGWLRALLPDAILSDVQAAPWLDLVADAQRLPFRSGSLDNIVMLDVLHHVEVPALFLAEAERVLKPGGRLVMLEPAITPLSRLAFALFHDEPVDMAADPLAAGTPTPGRDPYASNQAIPTLLFGRARARFERRFPRLRLAEQRRLSLFAYPASGGFRRFGLIAAWAVAPLLKIEDMLLPLLGPLMAFRLLVTLERRA
ncbi:MAG: class I SAM-dependent methyltransferase [Alphaproteobacteria bacterium]